MTAYDLLIPGAYKADLFRLCELYINGGYYCDITMVNIKSLKYLEKFTNVDCILTKDRISKVYENPDDKYAIYNAFLACKPKCKIIKHLIKATVDNILKRNMGSGPLDITGPIFLGNVLKDYMYPNIIKSVDNLKSINHELRKIYTDDANNASVEFIKCDEDENLLILYHLQSHWDKGLHCTVAHINGNNIISLIKTKYDGFMNERPKGSHYSDLYHAGKVYKYL